MLRAAGNMGCQFIDTINHSQGTKTFERGLSLVSPEIKQKIRNQSFGGQTFNNAWLLELYSSTNTWNKKSTFNCDFVPYAAMLNLINLPNYLNSIGKWRYIDTTNRKGNKHGFNTFYSDSVIDYTP
jgi:hypothetical protein